MNVCAARFRDTRHNTARIRFAQELLSLSSSRNIDCLCFPSGYITTSKIDRIVPLLEPLTRTARKSRISFIMGIDLTAILNLSADANSPEFVEIVRKQKMPCLLASFNGETTRLSLTRQRSCTGEHARRKLVSNEIMRVPRIMTLGDVCFQIVHCGEVYDRRLFSKGMPKAGIIFGHYTMPRLSRTMSACSRMGFSLVNTEHRSDTGGLLFCFDRGASKIKHCDLHIDHGDDLWAEMAVWELNNAGRFRSVQ
jgi:hypothetical protein